MEKDQPEQAGYKLDDPDRAPDIDAVHVRLFFRSHFLETLFGKVGYVQRPEVDHDQHGHHDGDPQHPGNTQVADCQAAEDRSAQEGNSVRCSNKAIGLISLLLGD